MAAVNRQFRLAARPVGLMRGYQDDDGALRAIEGDYPTEMRGQEAFYRSAFVPILSIILVGPILGLGRAALVTIALAAPAGAQQASPAPAAVVQQLSVDSD